MLKLKGPLLMFLKPFFWYSVHHHRPHPLLLLSPSLMLQLRSFVDVFQAFFFGYSVHHHRLLPAL
uniref:Uncharacterized protein n=1 Tax=Arundo donax TaxID=35708 RepID=A0A0A9DXG8_ARUDO